MKELNVAIIGCGNLGLSIVHGLLVNESVVPGSLTVTKRNIETIRDLEVKGVRVTTDNAAAVRTSDLVLIAVKPYDIEIVLREIRDVVDPEKHTLVSLATGVTLQEIEGIIQKPTPLFRAMPNIATDIRESVTCICQSRADNGHREAVELVFDHLGTTLHINEDLMEAATILGACGIAYVLRFIRAMIQGGIQIGFDAETAKNIVNQTVKGAAELLITKNEHPEMEIDKVTTPKGCTIVGLNEMEHQGFSSSLIRGIVASFEKIEK
ncbi:MAG: pyrroline-5-carboxylate reductase [Bacteroidetes bacterium]|nr:pyrroline-5-carboxylate reductase [Bacteroidota bacterium]